MFNFKIYQKFNLEASNSLVKFLPFLSEHEK